VFGKRKCEYESIEFRSSAVELESGTIELRNLDVVANAVYMRETHTPIYCFPDSVQLSHEKRSRTNSLLDRRNRVELNACTAK